MIIFSAPAHPSATNAAVYTAFIGRVSGPTINFIPNLKCIRMLDFWSIFVFLLYFFPLITVFDGRPGCPRVT